MSKFVGDALVGGGPQATSAPEVVTVQLTRGQAEVMAQAAQQLAGILIADGFISEGLTVQTSLNVFRAQIGGSR